MGGWHQSIGETKSFLVKLHITLGLTSSYNIHLLIERKADGRDFEPGESESREEDDAIRDFVKEIQHDCKMFFLERDEKRGKGELLAMNEELVKLCKRLGEAMQDRAKDVSSKLDKLSDEIKKESWWESALNDIKKDYENLIK